MHEGFDAGPGTGSTLAGDAVSVTPIIFSSFAAGLVVVMRVYFHGPGRVGTTSVKSEGAGRGDDLCASTLGSSLQRRLTSPVRRWREGSFGWALRGLDAMEEVCSISRIVNPTGRKRFRNTRNKSKM